MAILDADVSKAPPFFQASATLDDGDSMDLKPGEQGLDCLEVHSITHGGGCDVVIRVDSNNDGTYDREVTVDGLSGSGTSQGNKLELGAENMVLRVTDTSGGSDNDYVLTGEMLR